MPTSKSRPKSTSATPPPWVAVLSDDLLRDAAGGPAFERGLACAAEGRLELMELNDTGASFDVRGSRRYAVDLDIEDGELDAECDCWQAAGGRFCKHIVAAVLLWRRQLGGGELPEPPPPDPQALAADERKAQARAKAAQTRASKRDALLAFLQQQPAAALAQWLWQRADADRELMAALQAWSATAAVTDDPRALPAAVDALLKVSKRQFLERRDVQAWVDRAEQALALLRTALPQQAAQVRGIVEQALPHAADVQQRASGTSVDVQTVIDALFVLLHDALRAAPPAADWGEKLLLRARRDVYGLWLPQPLLAAAGPDARRGYSRALAKAWKALADVSREPARAGSKRTRQEIEAMHVLDAHRSDVRTLMLDDLQAQDDPAAVFDFMQRTARDAREHAALIRWCNAHGRARDALLLAHQAHRQFPGDWHIEDLLLEAYQRDGWDDEALALLQKRFDADPSVMRYVPLLQAARAAKADLAAVRRAALARAQSMEEAAFQQGRGRQAHWYGEAAPQGRDVSRSVSLLLHDGAVAEALALARPPLTCDVQLLEALADKLPAPQNAEAAALLERCLAARMTVAQTPYTDALRTVGKLLRRLNPAQAQALRAQLAAAHKIKRNFVAGLAQLD